jgi:hypothetical protein
MPRPCRLEPWTSPAPALWERLQPRSPAQRKRQTLQTCSAAQRRPPHAYHLGLAKSQRELSDGSNSKFAAHHGCPRRSATAAHAERGYPTRPERFGTRHRAVSAALTPRTAVARETGPLAPRRQGPHAGRDAPAPVDSSDRSHAPEIVNVFEIGPPVEQTRHRRRLGRR